MEPLEPVEEQVQGKLEVELVIAAVPYQRGALVSHRRGDLD